ncbi:hypothetical protein FRACYDRAFT_264790 [Fragilariopsis cylindrus CCMP1102]|uniref:GRIP domain-containing protein n=1 Tax=Fragilariopsis cylindrus CCMP1102 TaxID=635003 RepID=A0A1E7EPJ5_9STRA|nr:hypothetical protein FRACYDRAFT_264790 [Fragilariopsis cylindrus CCMP1102]|eukprot:OEU07910.1 hypothetical protein FRACYDRAFT_264790 [Fragilariopsis cylindrus CCMP1102]
MWGNLADRIGATDINSALEKIGNAVAPREGIVSKVASTTPFRFAGMLATRALGDNNTRRSPVENADYTESNDDDDDEGIKLFTQKLLKKDEDYMEATRSLNNDSANNLWADDDDDEDEEFAYKNNKTTTDKDRTLFSSISIPEKEKNQPVSGKYLTTTADYNDVVEKIMDKRRMTVQTAVVAPVIVDKKLPHTTTSVVVENVKDETNGMVQTASTPVVVVVEKLSQTTSVIENVKDKTNDNTKQVNQLNVSRKEATKLDKEQVGLSFAGTSIGIEEESSKVSSSLDNTEKRNHDGQETLLPATGRKQTPPEPEPPVLGRYGSQDTTDKKIAVNVIAVDKSDTYKPIDKTTKQKLLDAEFNCKELQIKLELANQEMEALRSQVQRDKEKAEIEKDELITQFTSKEVRLLQATSEENQNQTLLLEQEFSTRIQTLEQSLVKERQEAQEEQAEYRKLLRESYANVDRTENQLKATLGKYENEISQAKQQEERVLRKADDRVAQTMAILDERDEEISRLKKSIRSIESKAKEHKEGEEEADEELDELHEENDSLRLVIENLKLDTKKVRDELSALKSESENSSGLRMELTMLKEQNNREKSKNNSLVDSAMSSRTQIESERDTALSELRDAKQQLAAALGDLEISRADNTRIMTANNNLQSALEAFQDERQAEMGMIDEQRREAEEGVKSAHATATSALKQIHEAEMYEIQKAGDKAVKNLMHEMELLENDMEKLKSEKNQMRRSLDEAIHRLQSTQEDVIDRNMMKNILVDWCTLNDQNKREQILQLMANLLHFSEDEREKVHLTSTSHRNSVGSRVVGALRAPLPPSKADIEHLEGSNVREKWINFLMAETDDG